MLPSALAATAAAAICTPEVHARARYYAGRAINRARATLTRFARLSRGRAGKCAVICDGVAEEEVNGIPRDAAAPWLILDSEREVMWLERLFGGWTRFVVLFVKREFGKYLS